jgi:hypothetical protein
MAAAQEHHRFQGVQKAWLFKAKSQQAKAKWLSSSVKRHFTIDFDRHVFSYTKGLASGTTDQESYSFADLLLVVSEAGPSHVPPLQRASTLQSLVSWKTSETEQSHFTVHTRSRELHLATENADLATTWVHMLTFAVELGQGARVHEQGAISQMDVDDRPTESSHMMPAPKTLSDASDSNLKQEKCIDDTSDDRASLECSISKETQHSDTIPQYLGLPLVASVGIFDFLEDERIVNVRSAPTQQSPGKEPMQWQFRPSVGTWLSRGNSSALFKRTTTFQDGTQESTRSDAAMIAHECRIPSQTDELTLSDAEPQYGKELDHGTVKLWAHLYDAAQKSAAMREKCESMPENSYPEIAWSKDTPTTAAIAKRQGSEKSRAADYVLALMQRMFGRQSCCSEKEPL